MYRKSNSYPCKHWTPLTEGLTENVQNRQPFRISGCRFCAVFACLAGLEPATLCLEGRCSIRLSYRHVIERDQNTTYHAIGKIALLRRVAAATSIPLSYRHVIERDQNTQDSAIGKIALLRRVAAATSIPLSYSNMIEHDEIERIMQFG
jgi:hypothetical protein